MIRRAGLAVLLCSVLALVGASVVPAGAGTGPVAAPPRLDSIGANETTAPGAGATAATTAGPALRANAAAPSGGVHAAATWSFMTTPNRGAIDNHIQEVSCINTTRCVAVGYNQNGNNRASVVQALTNGTWKLQNIPQRGNLVNTLWNVSCVAGNKCWAAGYYFDPADARYKTLIALYSGGFWSLVASPNQGGFDNFLFGIDCTDATHCVAVGRYQTSAIGKFRTLILALNGTSTWTIMTSPNRSTSTTNNFLADVSCGDATHCQAVGYSVDNSGVFATLALERIDNTWSLRSTRNVTGASNDFRDVSCLTATDCVAVGASDTSGAESTLIERLSAGAWTIEASPDVADNDNHLWGVSCASLTDCVAVGQSQKPVPSGTECAPDDTRDFCRSKTLVTTLAAGTWTLTPSPSRGGTFNFMYGVSCPSATRCTAGGDYVNIGSGHYRTSVITSN